jgi:RND family efflux transporter MFP subunit
MTIRCQGLTGHVHRPFISADHHVFVVREALHRVPTRVVLWLVAAAGLGVAVLGLQSGAAAPASFITAARNDIAVSVGGVGRIVEANGSSEIAVPTTNSVGAATGGSASATATASADAVFPRTSGHLLRFLVKPGQHVAAGQKLALIDDDGAASAAVAQARNDLSAALLEFEQKQTSDPSKGTPPTSAELAAADQAVTAARQRLVRQRSGPRAADVSAARLDVKRAVADLQTLKGGSRATRTEAIRLAKQNVRLAKTKLGRLFAPPTKSEVSAADADVEKAASELAALKNPPLPPLPEAVKAVQSGVTAAKDKLAKLTGTPDPTVILGAQAELAKAEADLAVLQRTPPAPLPEALAAAEQAVSTAQTNLDDAKRAVPKDPVAVSAAEVEVARALAEQAALRQPAPAPLPAEIASLQAAIDNARAKLSKAQGPPDAADVSAARAELDRALGELATLERPTPAPLPKAIAAARQALAAARTKRATLGRPNPADVAAARLDLSRARADLRALKAGPTADALAAGREAIRSARAKLAQLKAPPPRADVMAAKADIRKAEADLAVLRTRGGPATATEINLAELKVEGARTRLAAARAAGQLLAVRAPSAGTVTALSTVPGAPVDGTTPIATVADLDHLAVAVGLSEFDAASVKKGMPALISVDALGGKKFPGKVLFAALTGVDSGGVVTFPVLVSLAKTAGLKPGMNVSVRIIVATRHDVVQIPLEAVSRDGDEPPTVTVLNPAGKELSREVQLGLANNKIVEVVKGLHAGERVVLAESDEDA